MQKILIIRFSSIGDLVLTSPIIRCVKLQTNAELHFLIKENYVSVLESNPYIDRLIVLKKKLKQTLLELKLEQYDFIIDLQNSIRSFWLKLNLRATSVTVRKKNFEKFFYINFGINLLKDHVVDRYFNALKRIHVINDNKGLDYFFESNTSVSFNVENKFIAWCVGASYEHKTLSKEQIVDVCNNLSIPIVLLGGKREKVIGNHILKESSNQNIYNFCGSISLDQSSYLISKSALVLTNDTGLMHIAASFQKQIISFWGCTKPKLGFYPYMADKKSIQIIFNPLKRPCSKHGSSCRLTEKGCVKNIKSNIILEKIKLCQII